MGLSLDRAERLNLLKEFIAVAKPAEECPDAGQLLRRMNAGCAAHAADPAYAPGTAGRRSIQRDLKELVDDETIEIANPGGRPLRYRRTGTQQGDSVMREYAQRVISGFAHDLLPKRVLDPIWARLRREDDILGLGEDKLVILSDSLRLRPAEIKKEAFLATLYALADSRTLEIGYRDAQGKITRPTLHPQAMMQRGARVYLFALKNDETFVRMYALHRMTSAKLGTAPARPAKDFRLDEQIRRGQADFGTGEMITLEVLATGYVADLLRDCPLTDPQKVDDEPEGSGFDVRITATVPETGQLYRWLLGCGDKVKVLAPEKLRRAIAAQAKKTAKLYTS